MILAHNHPSGNPKPSQEDINLTRRIKEAASLFVIKIHDHVIVACSEYTSLADMGFV